MGRLTRLTVIPLLVVTFACSVQSGYSLGAEDNGTTKNVTVGKELRLVLSGDLDWILESTNTAAVALKSTQMGNVGGTSVRIGPLQVRLGRDHVLSSTRDA